MMAVKRLLVVRIPSFRTEFNKWFMSPKLKDLQSNQQRCLTGYRPTLYLKEFCEKSAIRTSKVKEHFWFGKQINWKLVQGVHHCTRISVPHLCYVFSTCIIASKERKQAIANKQKKETLANYT